MQTDVIQQLICIGGLSAFSAFFFFGGLKTAATALQKAPESLSSSNGEVVATMDLAVKKLAFSWILLAGALLAFLVR